MPRTPLRMPKLSMTMTEGELAGWRISVGDAVVAGQVLCDVLTDKVDMEVESPATGTVAEIALEPGSTVAVGTPMAWIESAGEGLLDGLVLDSPRDRGTDPTPPADPVALPIQPATPSIPPIQPPMSPIRPAMSPIRPAMPAARLLAAEAGLDLAAVPGRGPGAAVLVSDVRAALADAGRQVQEDEPEQEPEPEQEQAPGPDREWAARAEALRPSSPSWPAWPAWPVWPALWRDVVLPPGPDHDPPGDDRIRLAANLIRAVATALAGADPGHRPRIGLSVPTPAGLVTVSFPAAATGPPAELAQRVADAVAQARSGRVDVRYLGPPEAVLLHLDEADRVDPQPVPGATLAIGAGRVADRPVVTGAGIGVRATLTLSIAGDPGRFPPTELARLLASMAAALGR